MHEIFRRLNSGDDLYPPIQPFDVRMLPAGDGHRIYVEQCGSPQGMPVLCIHGGPGGGCTPSMRRFFDPSVFRIILFDQRGCGKSTPRAGVTANTTAHLISDIEHIRQVLGVDRWILFGGSWGATLALLYAQAHPDTVIHLVLRAVFLMTRRELAWFYGGGAGQFWPEHWNRFRTAVPAGEQDDLIAAYHKRLFSGDYSEEVEFGRRWHEWEMSLCKLDGIKGAGSVSGDYARTFARLESHYFLNGGFLDSDGQILDSMGKLESIPGTIVHGRYDIVCPPVSAWMVAERWKCAQLEFVTAGHALSEPEIRRKLVSTMDALRDCLPG